MLCLSLNPVIISDTMLDLAKDLISLNVDVSVAYLKKGLCIINR